MTQSKLGNSFGQAGKKLLSQGQQLLAKVKGLTVALPKLDKAAPGSREEVRNVRLRSIALEIILPLSVITGLSFIWGEGTRYISVSPHPFWAVLLPAVVRHGTQRGVVCALLCGLFLLVGNLPVHQAGEGTYDYFFRVMGTPLLWILAAIVLGELCARRLQELKTWRTKASDALTQKETVQRSFDNLKAVKEALEVRIAAEFRAPSALLRVVRGVINESPDQVLQHFIKGIRDLVNPDKFSIYTVKEGRLDAIYQHGWTDADGFEKSFDSKTPLYQAIVGHKYDLCVIDKAGEKILGKQGVLAVPLVSHKTGAVFFMVKFEKVSFRELNVSNIEAIRELCRCASRAYIMSLEILRLQKQLPGQSQAKPGANPAKKGSAGPGGEADSKKS